MSTRRTQFSGWARTVIPGTVSLLLVSQPGFAQCPSKISSTVLGALANPEIRATAGSMTINDAWIAANGGVQRLIARTRAEIAEYDSNIIGARQSVDSLSDGAVPRPGAGGRSVRTSPPNLGASR